MNPKKTIKSSLFGRVGVLALCLSGATVAQAANTLNWTAAAVGGDLMEPTNWDKQTVVPASGDKLTVDAQKGVQFGTYTFPERMPASGALNTLNFLRGGGTSGVLDPGKDHALYAQYLNIRYSAIFSILSGRYFLTTSLGAGNSTSNSDTTYLTISGEDTFLQAPTIAVGTGSDSVGQSKAHVLVSDNAVVDAVPSIGQNGGWKNLMTVSGEGTHLYSTNGAVVNVGSTTVIVKKDGQPTGAICYSRENFLMVSNKADFAAFTVRVGADDPETKDNAFLLADHATATLSTLQVSGTNVVRVSDGSTLGVSSLVAGYAAKDDPRVNGALFDVTNALVAVTKETIVGSNGKDSFDNELRVSGGGVLTTPTLSVGSEGLNSFGNVLRIKPDGVVTGGTFYAQGSNRVEVAGLLVVTNTVNVGRVVNATGGIGGSELKVCGGKFLMDREATFYMGAYNKISDGNKVSVTDGGQLILTNANYLYIGAMGRNNELTVSGAGSRLVHYPVTTGRQTYVGVVGSLSSVKHPEYTSDNTLTVSDGASFWTRSSLVVGQDVSNCTFTVDQATAIIGETVEIGNGSTLPTPTLMKIVGSNARLTVTTLKVGAEGRIVFDLADATSSTEALVRLTSAPTFAVGSKIYITSSHPKADEAEGFDVTLLSCAADMDLSNVDIEIDPASGLRRWEATNPRVLRVKGGRRPGIMLIVR